MTDPDRERRLAEAFADLLDRRALHTTVPELAPELDALAEIDRALGPADTLPVSLSGHRILSEIGAGGMGRVFLADDEALGRKVAIKTLAPRYAEDQVLRARFMHEARAMARLNHPNIVRIYRLGEAGEPPHFVMEYLEGAPLNRAAARLTWDQKAELMHKVAVAADFLHAQGIIHRDLKPGNILVGPDLEPKLLDFGLALEAGRDRLSRVGEIAGTPEYLSPEQANGVETPDARSDIFSLGAVLYELLTGSPPFAGNTVQELLAKIRTGDPVLPRRLNPAVPKDLQSICLKALEKDPANRYTSAREMADDLRRFLAREPVLAAPSTYARLIAGQVSRHLSEVESWRHDRIISDAEYDGIRKRYERLLERDDSWILEARRLTLPQVTLYLGAWVLAVAAALLVFFPYRSLAGAPAVLVAWAAALPMCAIGVRHWNRGNFRVAIGYLLALCLLVPVATLVTLEEAHWLTALTRGNPKLEFFHRLEFSKEATNTQLWWAILAGLPVCWWLRRFTRAPVFSLMFAVLAAMLCGATLLRMGLIDWIDHDPGRPYFYLLPCAVLFMTAGFALERLRLPDDSRYFYPFAVAFTWAALTGVAAQYTPYAEWLKRVAPWTRGQIDYLYFINAAIYLSLDRLCDLFSSAQVRTVGKAFRFVIAGHILLPLLLLGIAAKSQTEARVFEWLLPIAACAFVFASIPRQMKNFFVSGLLFLAAGLFRLQDQVFPGRAGWPIFLLACGLCLMLAAANYTPLKMRFFRRR